MKRLATWVVAVVVFAAIAFGIYRLTAKEPAPPPPAPPAIPVEVASATRTDVPFYLTGLGTVQAFNTVTVTARVDGQLQKVAFVEGQEVKKGDVLAQIDPRPYKAALDMAAAKKAQDEAQLANAQHDVERYVTLSAQNYTSKQTLDTTRALVAQLDAQVKGDQAAIDSAKVQLDYTTILAPIDGRTGIRLIDEGNIVHASDTGGIVVITQLHPISTIFTLPEDQMSEVSTAMSDGPVSVTALSRDDKNELDQGKIALIDNQIDQTTGTIRLKAVFPNTRDTLWPGEFVNVRLLLGTRQNALVIPSAAVQRGTGGLYTYVAKPDGTVEVRPLEVSEDTGKIAVIDKGLTDGESVVTAGQYRLQAGSHIKPKANAATSAAGKDEVAEKAAK